jgi:hypothetical protein
VRPRIQNPVQPKKKKKGSKSFATVSPMSSQWETLMHSCQLLCIKMQLTPCEDLSSSALPVGRWVPPGSFTISLLRHRTNDYPFATVPWDFWSSLKWPCWHFLAWLEKRGKSLPLFPVGGGEKSTALNVILMEGSLLLLWSLFYPGSRSELTKDPSLAPQHVGSSIPHGNMVLPST